MPESGFEAPLAGLTVVELSRGVAAGYAGRMLATLGAETILVEPPGGNPLRTEPPYLEHSDKVSALFAYLAAGKRSVVCDAGTATGRADLWSLVATADIFVTDFRPEERAELGLDEASIEARYPSVIDVSVLPFGAHGPKSGWHGAEINLMHASGEGFLMPNGLATELFPDRPPLKVHGHFAEMQGGLVAAIGAVSALVARDAGAVADSVDVSVQDAMLAVGAFAIQRLGDGEVEHRVRRSFKYGGVIECADGYVQLLTLEERQWQGLVELMGRPDWALEPALSDSLERSRRGKEINQHIRAWALGETIADLVARAQKLGVPMGKYASPAEVLADPHEKFRELFQEVEVPGAGTLPVLVAPFHIDERALKLKSGPPRLGEHHRLLRTESTRNVARPVEVS